MFASSFTKGRVRVVGSAGGRVFKRFFRIISDLHSHSFGTGLALLKCIIVRYIFNYFVGASVLGSWLRFLYFGRAVARVNL